MKHFTIAALTLATSMGATHAQAEVRFNGFASIVAGMNVEDKKFRNSPYDEDLSFKPESKFALQATADLGNGLSAIAQVIARGEENFDAEFEWAYLKYEFSEHHSLRAGRLRLPFYKYSDYLDVGYAYPWLRTPKAMYRLLFSTYDGISLISQFTLGEIDVTSNFLFGSTTDTFFSTTAPVDGTLKNWRAVNVQLSKDWWNAYIAYFGTEVDIPHAATEAAAGNLEASAIAIDASYVGVGNNIKLDEDYGDFFGLGFTLEPGNWFVGAEWSTISIEDTLYLDSSQWYLSVGHRFDSLMPYITYQQTDTDRNTSTAQLFPAPVQATVQTIYDGLQFEYKAVTLGLRYDFHPRATLKIEYNMFHDIIDLNQATRLGTATSPEDLDMLAVGVDLLF
ncbi:MAG: porin [Cellvibrionaceae bacterium]